MTLMPAERSSYHTLIVKLGLRFSNARQQQMWISRLEARVQGLKPECVDRMSL